MIRRSLLTAASAVLALSGLAACSTGSTDSADTGQESSSKADSGAFPVSIKHAYGEAKIEKEPKRVAVVGVDDADMLLSLGVVPVSIPKVTWGGDEDGTTPWFDDKLKELGADQPAILDQTDAVPVDEVAKQNPDLILATYSGITKAEYKKLSEIAPVVAFPDQPWATPWQDSLEMVGKATGRNKLADEVEAETEKTIETAKKDNPEIQGKTFVWASLATADLSKIPFYTTEDARPEFLTQLGMKNAPYVEANTKKGQFFTEVSAEKASELKSDFFFTYAVEDKDAETFRKDKLIGQIPAIKNGHMWASTDNVASLAAGIPTPLSVPYAIDEFVPGIVKAVEGQ
ncbi:iron complex transport system substrate-binding protein [Nocardioides albertanoniae]|uniref:Iron complex transport system substrate-binding protein n=1 Tax=Nocardioides albertanoniae TaxID=1175486 RepID=A0A543A2I5_9ACTN|nr:iron-siderophore ABC transporter substrate-binding protein [Nocardioides albertanoniae]TQL66770.1 iron complex transport system substrate-binding protein [Nocardioides albertanoniae]